MNGLSLTERDGGVLLKVRAAPGAKVEKLVGVHGDALKIAVQAPPERGRANERLLEVLAEALGLATRALRVVQGAASRDKTVLVAGLTAAELRQRLAAQLG